MPAFLMLAFNATRNAIFSDVFLVLVSYHKEWQLRNRMIPGVLVKYVYLIYLLVQNSVRF